MKTKTSYQLPEDLRTIFPSYETEEVDRTRWITPLDYMLSIVNDPAQPTNLRARMAAAAAPFVHPRKSDTPGVRIQNGGGIRRRREAEAKEAGLNTEWAEDLQPKNIN